MNFKIKLILFFYNFRLTQLNFEITMKKLERRKFLKSAAIGTIGAGTLLSGCSDEQNNNSPAIISNKKYEWKMVTTWAPHFPLLGVFADKIAKWIEEMSEGRMKIQVYGGGELVPPFESFDAVSQGIAEMGHGAAYYWAGKVPASQFFTSLPFGMNTQETNSWLHYGGGLDLWKEAYEKFNIIPMSAGNTGGQMGGWFNKEINSMQDFKGVKMRIPGVGGKVFTKAGGSAVLSPGSELYTNLERGVLDALEWIGPYHDYLMGFHKIAKYYYSPGWQEATGVLELIINKSAFNSLPKDLQFIISRAADSANMLMPAEFYKMNSEYLIKMKEDGKVQFKTFSDDILKRLRELSIEVLDEIAASDSMSKKVWESYKKFFKEVNPLTELVEKSYPAF